MTTPFLTVEGSLLLSNVSISQSTPSLTPLFKAQNSISFVLADLTLSQAIGGGIEAFDSTVVITDVIASNCIKSSTSAPNPNGGFLYATTSAVSVARSYFFSCTGAKFGGAFVVTGGSFSVADSSFNGNTAWFYGGSIVVSAASEANLTNIAFSNGINGDASSNLERGYLVNIASTPAVLIAGVSITNGVTLRRPWFGIQGIQLTVAGHTSRVTGSSAGSQPVFGFTCQADPCSVHVSGTFQLSSLNGAFWNTLSTGSTWTDHVFEDFGNQAAMSFLYSNNVIEVAGSRSFVMRNCVFDNMDSPGYLVRFLNGSNGPMTFMNTVFHNINNGNSTVFVQGSTGLVTFSEISATYLSQFDCIIFCQAPVVVFEDIFMSDILIMNGNAYAIKAGYSDSTEITLVSSTFMRMTGRVLFAAGPLVATRNHFESITCEVMIATTSTSGSIPALVFNESTVLNVKGGAIFVPDASSAFISEVTFLRNTNQADNFNSFMIGIGCSTNGIEIISCTFDGSGGIVVTDRNLMEVGPCASSERGGSVLIQSCLFANNMIYSLNQGDPGALVSMAYMVTTIEDAVFENNIGLVTIPGYASSQVSSHNVTYIVRSTFRNSLTSKGVLFFEPLGSVVEVDDCTFVGNENYGLSSSGGAINAVGTTTEVFLLVNNSLFSQNTAAYGGAIALEACQAFVESSLFIYNTANDDGGAVLIAAADAFVSRCWFEGNLASFGGAFATDGELSAINCAFTMNSAVSAGSVFFTEITSGAGFFVDSTFSENSALRGVAYVLLGSGSFVGCSFTMNSGGSVVGLLSSGLTVNNSVFLEENGQALNGLRTKIVMENVMVSTCDSGPLAAIEIVSTPTAASFTNVVVFNNVGLGVQCTSSTVLLGSSTDLLSCGNTLGEVGCRACSSPLLCGLPQESSCLGVCSSPTFSGYCVDQVQFAGPYDGCYTCGGACLLNNTCPFDTLCQDTQDGGSYCECESGFNFYTTHCVDIDECALGPCPLNSQCLNTPGSFSCSCSPGYRSAGGGTLCVDINECTVIPTCHSCTNPNEVCLNADGSFTCECGASAYGSPMTTCLPCPGGSATGGGPATTTLADCACAPFLYRSDAANFALPCEECPAGWSMESATVCMICSPDTYSSAPRSSACVSCPIFSSTNGSSGADSVDACVCLDGYRPLPLSVGECIAGVRSWWFSLCGCYADCPPGTFVESDSPPQCTVCPPDTYSDGSNYYCLDCPPLSTTEGRNGSISLADCICPANYALDSAGAGSCVIQCEPGTWRTSQHLCLPCPANSYTDAPDSPTCILCPANSVTVNGEPGKGIDDCVCAPGFALEDAGPGGSTICAATCGPGTYRASPEVCRQCPQGSYRDDMNLTECSLCMAGATTSGPGASSPTQCTCEQWYVEGVDSLSGERTCTKACPPGYFLPDAQASCVGCPPNTFSATINEATCTECPFNTHTEGGSADSSLPPLLHDSAAACVCDDGFVLQPGSPRGSFCTLVCEPGSFLPTLNARSCELCPVNTYATQWNSTLSCPSCPDYATTQGAQGARLASACSCSAGYYRVLADVEALGLFTCVTCPTGATCDGGDSLPVPNDGYLLVDDRIVQCTPAEACVAGACAEGYEGSLCSTCDEYYFRLEGRCKRCTKAGGLIAAAVALALFVFCLVVSLGNLEDRPANKFAASAIARNSLQIMALFGRIDLNWPPVAKSIFEVLSFTNFNVELVSPECAASSRNPFVLRWVLMLSLPLYVVLNLLAVFCVLALVHKCGPERYFSKLKNVSRRHIRHTVQRSFYQVLVIVYLPLSSSVLGFFACTPDGSGQLVLANSPDMPCYTPLYTRLLVVAFVGVILYPVGIPALYSCLLQWKRRSLGEVKFFVRYNYLVGRFKAQFFYFELFVMARKLGIVICMTFLSTNTGVQALGAVVVITMALMAHVFFVPYHSNLYNIMEMVCLLCPLFLLTMSMMLEDVSATSPGKIFVIVAIIVVNLLMIVFGVLHDVRKARILEPEADSSEEFADDDNVRNKQAIELTSLGRVVEADSCSTEATPGTSSFGAPHPPALPMLSDHHSEGIDMVNPLFGVEEAELSTMAFLRNSS